LALHGIADIISTKIRQESTELAYGSRMRLTPVFLGNRQKDSLGVIAEGFLFILAIFGKYGQKIE